MSGYFDTTDAVAFWVSDTRVNEQCEMTANSWSPENHKIPTHNHMIRPQ